MYSITSRERRITNYVKMQCYVWLYNKIEKGEYESHSNESDNVLLKIRSKRKFDDQLYSEFCSMFVNDPYSYMLNHNKKGRLKGITTRALENHFVKFNGVLLPAGFVQSFFEDDYETQEDVKEFYKMYLNDTLNDFFISCKFQRNKIDEELNEITGYNHKLFNPGVWKHIVNFVIRIALPIFAFSYSISYFVYMLLILQNYDIAWWDPVRTLISAAGVLFTFVPVIRTIRIFAFYFRWCKLKIYLLAIKRALAAFDTKAIGSFRDHFERINAFLSNRLYLEDDPCLETPSERKHYFYIMDFDKSKLNNKIGIIVGKYKDKINILSVSNRFVWSLINGVIWSVLAFMVNSTSYYEYVYKLVEFIVVNVLGI